MYYFQHIVENNFVICDKLKIEVIDFYLKLVRRNFILSNIKGWKFPIDVDNETGKIKSVTDNDAIKQSVTMILQTQIFERKIFSRYGSELRSFMFDVIDSSYISSFKKSVKDSILSCEPYIQDLNVSVTAKSGPISKITAKVEYTTKFSSVVNEIYKSIDFSEKS